MHWVQGVHLLSDLLHPSFPRQTSSAVPWDAQSGAGCPASFLTEVARGRLGQSAEAIAQAFPVLNLEQVYGAITYYLAHRDDIDRYLESRRQDFAAGRHAARHADPMFYQKLTDTKKQTPLTR